MQLVRTRPFGLPQDIEAFFEALPRPNVYRFAPRSVHWTRGPWVPRVNVIETEDALTVRHELPGFEMDDLKVTLDGNLLTVKGTRSSDIPEGAVYRVRESAEGAFSRSIRVADHFDPEKVEARLSLGVLEILMHKRPEVLPRTIQIEAAQA